MLPIARPPFENLGRKIESALRKALYEYEMLEGADKVAVALSGGKDSLTLLYLLHAINGRGVPPFEIVAIHVGGEFSCGAGIEGGFLKAICNELNIPFISLKSSITKDDLECYSCSRDRRKRIFDAAKEVGAKVIAFGHTRDDNAQTLLLNLMHKGEFAGLLPKIEMIDYGVTIIRPLILVGESEIRLFAQKYKYARITCQCPYGQNSMRKKVDTLITNLEDLFPNVRQNVASASLLYGSQKAKGTNRNIP